MPAGPLAAAAPAVMPPAGYNGPPKGKYGSGQNSMNSDLCMATMLNGSPCMEKKAAKNVPYCAKCWDSGDPSLAVVKHPRFGETYCSLFLIFLLCPNRSI